MAKAKRSKAKKSKAKKSKAKKASKKNKKTARAAKAKVKARKSKKPARKAAKKSVAKKAAPKKAAAKKAPVVGEGDYAASRSFDKAQAGFVKRNETKIPAMGKEAEAALEGPEGASLRAAEDDARARSRE